MANNTVIVDNQKEVGKKLTLTAWKRIYEELCYWNKLLCVSRSASGKDS